MYEADQPKYRKLASILRERIEGGEYADGAALPSEPQLAREHGMSRPTVVRALDLLRRDGLIVSEQGRGTFVRRPAGADPVAELQRLADWLAERFPQHMTVEANPVDVAIALLEPRGAAGDR